MSKDGALEDIEGTEWPGAGAEPTAMARVVAERVYRAREDRVRHFGPDLFADPAWDMLLDMFICQGRRALSVTAATTGARVAHATAIRYLKLLVERGLVERTRDASDARRTHVRLTPLGVASMESVLVRFERVR